MQDEQEGNGVVASLSMEPMSPMCQPNPEQVLLLRLRLQQAPGMWVSETPCQGFLHTYF